MRGWKNKRPLREPRTALPMPVRLIACFNQQKNPCRVKVILDTTGSFLIRVSSGERLLPWRQGDFHTTVLSPSLCSSIRGYGITFAEPLDCEILSSRRAVLYQVVCYRLSPPLRESHVVGICTDAIRVTSHRHSQRGLLFQRLENRL